MCTVTWDAQDGGYRLFFNRDELRRRLPARPPRRRRVGERQVLAPVDGDRGGTWLAVNDRGWTVCLLNREVAPPAEGWGERDSRGWLVEGLADVDSFRLAQRRLEALPAARYRPFVVLLVAPDGEARRALSDGRRLTALERPERALLASSSFDEPAAQAARARLYDAMAEEAAPFAAVGPASTFLAAFQRSHRPERGPLSPCMHRSDARTVSQCLVLVDERSVALAYGDGPPCRTPVGPPALLPRDRCSTVAAR